MRNPHAIVHRSGRALHAGLYVALLAGLLAAAPPADGPAHPLSRDPALTLGPQEVGVIDRLEFDTPAARPAQGLQRARPASGEAPSAPVLRNVPLGQRLRIEADCAGCHRIEDRQRPLRPLEHFVMT